MRHQNPFTQRLVARSLLAAGISAAIVLALRAATATAADAQVAPPAAAPAFRSNVRAGQLDLSRRAGVNPPGAEISIEASGQFGSIDSEDAEKAHAARFHDISPSH